MRALRVFLAMILTAGPVQAQPVVDLLSRYSIRADEAAAQAPEGDAAQGSGRQLAALEANLALLSEGLEGFANSEDADKALLAARPRLPIGTASFFKDRSTALRAIYRTLAVTDYTWALRFPNPPCSPAARRSALLRSGDGLFMDPISGKTSAWMSALLGPNADGKSLESALDEASASTPPTEIEYARLRARQNTITKALSASDAVGEVRAGLYCDRAETRVTLAAANRGANTVLASRSSEDRVSRQGIVIIAGITAGGLEARGAGIVIDTKSGIRVLTDRRLGGGEIAALFEANNAPVSLIVEREDEESGLLLLRPEGDLGEPLILADAAPKKDDLVYALAHSDRLGAWTKTQGLVTQSSPNQFQTDAVADASMTGGAVLDQEGRVAGLLVLRRVEGAMIDWPAAVPATVLRAWIDGVEAPAPASIALTDEGTTKILTASRPLLQSVAVGEGATAAGYAFDTQTQWGTIHAKCVANCDDASPGSSYSDNGGAELGQALGKLAAVGVEALIFKGIPALFRGLGSLFKSKPRQMIAESKPAPSPVPVPIQEVKVEPPPVECRVTKVGAPANIGIETAELKVRFSCDDPSVPVGNRKISFTLGWENEAPQYDAIIATTDANGYASISFRINNAVANAARGFNDLDRYDPDRQRQGVEAIAAAEPAGEADASQSGGLINASDSKSTKKKTVKTEAPAQVSPKTSNDFIYALTGTGRGGIRSVARVVAEREAVGAAAGRAVAGTAVRGAASSAAEGAAGSVFLGSRIPGGPSVKLVVAAVSFGIAWTLLKIADDRKEKAAIRKPVEPGSARQGAFDALDKENAATLEDEDDCSLKRGENIVDRFIDRTGLASGFVDIHETRGGHTKKEHIGKSIEDLLVRLDEKTWLEKSSSFPDIQTAETAIRDAVDHNSADIRTWLMSAGSKRAFIQEESPVLPGFGVSRGNRNRQDRRGTTIVLARREKCSILILSAFPDDP